MPQKEIYSVTAHFIVDKRRHIRIKGIHKLFWALDNRNLHTEMAEIFCKLKADKASSCQYDGTGVLFINIVLNAERVFYCAKGKETVNVSARNRGKRRSCPPGRAKVCRSFPQTLRLFPDFLQTRYCALYEWQ